MMGMTIPEFFDDVHSGETIWFDDGKIGGVIEMIEERTRLAHAFPQKNRPLW
jgi:pyruvate kinase